MKSTDAHIWQTRIAPPVSTWQRIALGTWVVAGIVSMLHFGDWWFREVHIGSLVLYSLLTFILWWSMLRMVIVWINYLGIRRPSWHPPAKERTVAIFTTSSPGEPLSMFDKTLEACARIRYPHTTYLLDDTRDPHFKAVAEKHGAIWLELVGLPGAKAGKINAALQRTNEELILVLDPDHIPFPNFLDEVAGFFDDEEVGYVQVSQAYYNQYRSFVADGAAQQTYTFYGPVQMSMHGRNMAVAIGANCTFRRKALESIGGHGIGLAEDLVTAIRIQSKGWKTIYHPVIVSRGLVPEDLGSFFKQQLKWSRGVHEVLFAELPRAWRGLTGWQRLSFFIIGTYYTNGLIMLLFFLLPFFFLWFGALPANMNFIDFIIRWTPIALVGITIYLYMQQWVCDPKERGLHLKAMFLKFASWPVFLLGFILSLVNKKIPYIPTAKKAMKGFTPFIWPLLIGQLLFLATILFVIIQRLYFTEEAALALSSGFIWGMVGFALIAFLVSLGGLFAYWQSGRLTDEEPWADVDLDAISITSPKMKRP